MTTDSALAQPTADREDPYGWVIVGLATVFWGLGMGSLLSISVFLKPLGAEFGWARGATSFAYLSAMILNGVAGIFAGMLADRFAARPFVVVGAISVGLAHLLLASIQSLWQLYFIYGFLIGFLALGLFKMPLLTSIQFWFRKNRGLATGLMLSGQTVGAATVPVVARHLIDAVGWRMAYVALGATMLAVLVPLSLLVRQPPGAEAVREASRKAVGANGLGMGGVSARTIVTTLSAAIILCCVCMSIPMVHVVALATDKGIDGSTAASVLSVLMVAGLVNRVSIGKLADRYGGFPSLLLSSALQTSAIFLFTQVDSVWGLYLVAIWFGIGYGGVIPSYAILVREIVPAHLVGRSTGVVLFFGSIGMGQGGFWAGRLFDLTGSYSPGFALGAAAGVLNLLIVGTLYIRVRSRLTVMPALKAA
ncbi:MAG: MFS transporter [Candidatus Lambdaproteobacteria bacterium]|nr:MFS transporter [Candidatus Lambdaproteobacteria bacterium]